MLFTVLLFIFSIYFFFLKSFVLFTLSDLKSDFSYISPSGEIYKKTKEEMKHLKEFEDWSEGLKEGFPYTAFSELGRRGYNKSREKYGTSGKEPRVNDQDLYKKLLEMIDDLKREEGEIVVKALSPGGGGMKELETLEIKPYKNFLYQHEKGTLDLDDVDFLYQNVQAPVTSKNPTGKSRVDQLKDSLMTHIRRGDTFEDVAEALKSKVPAYGKKSEEIKVFLEGSEEGRDKGGNWFKNLFK